MNFASSRSDLAVVILTHNEILHIERALRSVSSIASQVFVIDSYSTDGTVEVAERMGATVLQNHWVNYAKQFTWALENAPITASWVMRLDADEIIERDLAEEISVNLSTLTADVAGVNLDRRHIFLGRWIKHGGRFPLRLLRIWRRGQARIEDRWMDEHMIVTGGRTVNFSGGFSDYNLKDITFFTAKHNGYATREAIDVLAEKYALLPQDTALSARNASKQASAKRLLKERLYNRLPFWLSSTVYFMFRFFVQRGFLDGREGLIYHVLQGFWYRFLVGAKIVEFERSLADLTSPDARLMALEKISGHKLAKGLE